MRVRADILTGQTGTWATEDRDVESESQRAGVLTDQDYLWYRD